MEHDDFWSSRYPIKALPTPRINFAQYCAQKPRPVTLADTIVPDPDPIEPADDDGEVWGGVAVALLVLIVVGAIVVACLR